MLRSDLHSRSFAPLLTQFSKKLDLYLQTAFGYYWIALSKQRTRARATQLLKEIDEDSWKPCWGHSSDRTERLLILAESRSGVMLYTCKVKALLFHLILFFTNMECFTNWVSSLHKGQANLPCVVPVLVHVLLG